MFDPLIAILQKTINSQFTNNPNIVFDNNINTLGAVQIKLAYMIFDLPKE